MIGKYPYFKFKNNKMENNKSGNYLISIEGKKEEVSLEKTNQVLKFQSIKLHGDIIDLRSGIFMAMKNDESIANLILESAEYFQQNAHNVK
jgi:hypothetical protein